MAGIDTAPSRIAAANIIGVYGIKGWVKLRINLEDPASFSSFSSYMLADARGKTLRSVKLLHVRPQGKGFIAQLEGVNDRNAAEVLRGYELTVLEAELPDLAEGEFYWRDLVGCQVVTDYESYSSVVLGEVHHILDTGSNDVLVTRATELSIDDRERLIPYIEDAVVANVDLDAGVIRVKWHPDD